MEARHGEGAYAKQDNRFKPQEPLVDVQALVELGASFGPVAINRAYANWQYFGRYRDQLLQSAVELIQLFPPGASAKNGADIKLCLDATEDISRFAHIGTVIIIGGDSDFMPVAQKIKAAGRTLIGIGNRKNTNRHWAKSCHEFRYYDTLVEAPAAEEAPKTSEARDTPPPPPQSRLTDGRARRRTPRPRPRSPGDRAPARPPATTHSATTASGTRRLGSAPRRPTDGCAPGSPPPHSVTATPSPPPADTPR